MGANVSITLKYGSQLSSGDVFNLIFTPISNIVGDLKWLIIGLVLLSMMYTKGEHTVIVAIIGVIFTALTISSIPQESQIYALMFAALAIGIILYRGFYRND